MTDAPAEAARPRTQSARDGVASRPREGGVAASATERGSVDATRTAPGVAGSHGVIALSPPGAGEVGGQLLSPAVGSDAAAAAASAFLRRRRRAPVSLGCDASSWLGSWLGSHSSSLSQRAAFSLSGAPARGALRGRRQTNAPRTCALHAALRRALHTRTASTHGGRRAAGGCARGTARSRQRLRAPLSKRL
jgi:hypothetical protein